MDTTYRSEFRELFEVNFARFDAKLEQRLAGIKVELREEIGALRAELNEEIAAVGQRLVEIKAELREEITVLRAELRTALSSGLSGLESRLIKWMFVFWVGTLGTVVALIKL